MKKPQITILLVFCLSLFAIQCSQDSNPVGPELSSENQSGEAVLIGNFVASTGSAVDFGLIQVSIRGTNIQTQPDSNGDFQINGLPLGDQSVEVDVENNLSSFAITNIQSGEEIRMRLQIQANYSVMLQHMDRNRKSAEPLQFEIRPKKWNIDWVNSSDEGHARIYGTGFDTITSVEITGPTGIVIPVIRTEIGGVYYKAFFDQSAAIAAIPDPKRGDFHVITVTVTNDAGTQVLDPPYTIEIVGAKSEEDEEDLAMDIDPDKWNTNWIKSNGYVTVRFRGEGFDRIVTGATLMSYMGGTPISPFWDSITGSSYMAKFSKKEAIALFPAEELQKGATFKVDVTVTFDDSSTQTFSDNTIEIVGPNK